MTYRELYRQASAQLEQAGCDSPAFDAGCMLESFTGVSRSVLPLRGDESVSGQTISRMLSAVQQRADGRPLQYILGEWDFLSLTLSVGEGVLIPRPDTELLCETAAQYLADSPTPRVLDLCAGSGCVGLGIASLCPGAVVTAVELSEDALKYLRSNRKRYPQYAMTVVQADVLRDAQMFTEQYDAVVSNPPYIPTNDISLLMEEVQHEPMMALDGGDGLVFYRIIASQWLPKLVPGGFCAVEVGIGQASDVKELWQQAGLVNVQIFRDLGGVERVVIGKQRRFANSHIDLPLKG